MRSEDLGKKPSPEELLARVQHEERDAGRGRLKLFLGFAAGVGKTYEMLSEANRRCNERGQDVVIGYVVTHGRQGHGSADWRPGNRSAQNDGVQRRGI